MSLRIKIVLALVALSTMATIAIGAYTYVDTSKRLYAEVDGSLDDSLHIPVERLSGKSIDGDDGPGGGGRRGGPGGDREYVTSAVQVIDGSGTITQSPGSVDFPVGPAEQAVAATAATAAVTRRDVVIDDQAYRMATASIGGGRGAVQVIRSLAETNRVLDAMRDRTLVAVGLVIVAAAAAGWLIARQVTRRLVKLTSAAEVVATTGRLDVEVPVGGTDEAGRLGTAFNDMLVALARSRDDQQRLVQDAGHELRTPLTSLRTNISVLRRYDDLPPETRHQVLDDLDGETRELTALVNELVELATESRDDEPEEDVDLRELGERMADRCRRRSGRTVAVQADASVVHGRTAALERAVTNLLDNAAKFDQGDAPIELQIEQGRVQVLDRGPGVSEQDLPHLFDRFYRAIDARSRPGSGLGLAIVRDVAESLGGSVFASNRPGGGAVVGFVVPVTQAPGSVPRTGPVAGSGPPTAAPDRPPA